MKVKISNSDSRYTRVFLDDVEVHRVVSVEYSESIDEMPTLILEVRPDEIELECNGVDVTKKVLADKKTEDGYKDFIRFLFGGLVKKDEN